MEYSRLEIAEEVIKQLNLGEPIAVFSMPGMGKHYERKLLGELIEKNPALQNYKIVSKDFFTIEEMFEFLKEVETFEGKVIVIIGQCLNYGQDASWFVEQLNAIKDKKKNLELISVIFTSPSSVLTAIRNKIRLVTRVADFKKPLDKESSLLLINRYEKKYELELKNELKDKIYILTSGHIGMMKNLILELKLNSGLSLDIESLLSSESIKGWLFEITEDLNKEMLEVLTGIREDDELKNILIKCGYINANNEIFSPLLKAYLEKNIQQKFSTTSFESKLTDQEIKAYHKIKHSGSKIVSREDIAKAIWSDEWLDKYSDWAIDQLMHSLRDKMKTYDAKGKIMTIRGKGYKLV